MRGAFDKVWPEEWRALMQHLEAEGEPLSYCAIWQLPDGSKFYLMRSGNDMFVSSDLAIPTT